MSHSRNGTKSLFPPHKLQISEVIFVWIYIPDNVKILQRVLSEGPTLCSHLFQWKHIPSEVVRNYLKGQRRHQDSCACSKVITTPPMWSILTTFSKFKIISDSLILWVCLINSTISETPASNNKFKNQVLENHM